jgi:hypothetical protein
MYRVYTKNAQMTAARGRRKGHPARNDAAPSPDEKASLRVLAIPAAARSPSWYRGHQCTGAFDRRGPTSRPCQT